MKKIAFCNAFEPGFKILTLALKHHYPIEFVATSHMDSSPFEEKIFELAELHGIKTYRKSDLNSEKFIHQINSHQIDIAFLGWWPSILKKPILSTVKLGWINHHPSLLPHGRGKHPYYWSIVNNTPFGATLHFIDHKIDHGDILFQKEIPYELMDTGETLYKKSVQACIDLFNESYPKIINDKLVRIPQKQNTNDFHLSQDIENHSKIDLSKEYKAMDLINILRARTFTNGDSAYFYNEGEKYQIKVIIEKLPKK